jgi:DNA processing protein
LKVTDADLALNAASAWIGPVRAHRLLQAFGSSEAAIEAPAAALSSSIPRFKPDQAQAFIDFCRAFDPVAERAALEAKGVQVIKLGDAAYPARLAQLPDPPYLLHLRGELPSLGAPCIAVVGTRDPSDYGRRMARQLAEGFAKAGVWVVSGLAAGIDAEAHRACIEAGGRTLAVMGRGLNSIYPSSNRGLADQILAKGGGLLSQFSMQAGPLQMHFPMRNSVVSGLSLGVVVVEGELDSGSLITADRALDQNREVFAVPGLADAAMAQGPLHLLKQGAHLVRDAQDVLEQLRLAEPKPRTRSVVVPEPDGPAALDPGLDPATPAGRVWRALGAGPRSLDQLALDSGLNAGDLAAVVTELELLGAVKALPGARIERN